MEIKKIVEIYRTNIYIAKEAKRIRELLEAELLNTKIKFDLEDCDHILRVETSNDEINSDLIIEILSEENYGCEILPE